MTDWPAPSAAPEAWTHIDTQVLGAPAASISFAGIAVAAAPRLRCYAYIIKDGTAQTADYRFNNDGGNNYNYQRLDASGAAVSALRTAADTDIHLNFGIAANATSLAVLEVEKPVAGEVARTTSRDATVGGAGINFAAWAGEWTDVGALINRFDIISAGGNFVAGTRVVLEGAA